ncbi:unnamed protein product [Caenorhabditis sp. 36 PRJEB53466]|nr:unnamed protein product [Caenorhabditis sp. 36 PRJEB53466]
MIAVDINLNGKIMKRKIEHGVPFQVPETNISVIITGFSTPPTPVHTATFIKQLPTTEKGTPEIGFTYTSVAQAGAPTRGLIGEFQWAELKDAENFRCIFDERLCDCLVQGTTLSCHCHRLQLKEVMEKTKLPVKETGVKVLWEDEKIATKITTSALVAIQVKFQNQTVQRRVKEDDCRMEDVRIEGCFACGKGAKLRGNCIGSFKHRIEATVKCPTLGVHFMECGKDGKKTELEFNADGGKIEETCEINCGKKVNKFVVQGTLKEEATFDASHLRDKFAAYSEYVSNGSLLELVGASIKETWSSLVSGIGTWTTIGMLVIIVVIGLQCFIGQAAFSFWLLPRQCRRKRRYQKIRRRWQSKHQEQR